MGKKTDQFMKDLRDLQTEAGRACDAVSFPPSLESIAALMTQQTAIIAARHEFFMPGGVKKPLPDGRDPEAALESDPAYKTAVAAHAALEQKFDAASGGGPAAMAKFQASVEKVNLKIAEFEKFVKAKESKWFGHKKAIPAAKAVIASAKAYLGICRPML